MNVNFIMIVLSMAYETLSNPALKSIYDVSKPVNQSPKNYSSGYKQSNAEATFSNVLHQVRKTSL